MQDANAWPAVCYLLGVTTAMLRFAMMIIGCDDDIARTILLYLSGRGITTAADSNTILTE